LEVAQDLSIGYFGLNSVPARVIGAGRGFIFRTKIFFGKSDERGANVGGGRWKHAKDRWIGGRIGQGIEPKLIATPSLNGERGAEIGQLA